MSRLNFLSRQDAIKRMNYYGRRGIPFFFLIDFDEENCIVEEPDNLSDDEILFSFPSGGNYGDAFYDEKTFHVGASSADNRGIFPFVRHCL